MKKFLPIGIQNLPEIINKNYIYVDKTEIIYKLITEGKYYFLSRPRRFGKSLTISTLEEIFNGNKELFKYCWIYHSNWKWDKHPIIKIDFSSISERQYVKQGLHLRLNLIAKNNNLELNENFELTDKMQFLIENLYKKYNKRVVILVDEYDKIIVNNLINKNIAIENREILRELFSPIKGCDQYIEFCFLTGVSKFAKTSIFSSLNNIEDISISHDYSSLCGLTEIEILNNFDENISECAVKYKKNKVDLIDEIRNWYNGYNFSKENHSIKVYNPFSLINFFKQRDFTNFWINSGNTKFLFDFFTLNNYENIDFENIKISMKNLDKTDLSEIQLESLLLQTGYLTIDSYSHEKLEYKLKIPNFEVRDSFFSDLIKHIYKCKKEIDFDFLIKIKESIKNCEFEEFFKNLEIYFSRFQYDIQIKSEDYYQSLFYALFDLANIRAKTEENTNRGRIDLVIETENNFCIIELKLNKTAEIAIQQIKDRKYYQKYLKYNKEIYIFGINFNSEINNIDQYLFEKIDK